MSRSTTRRAATWVALGLAGAVALGGCSSGQIAETAVKVPAIPGTDVNVGDIAIRNAVVAFPSTGYNWPAGSNVPLQVDLINNGVKPDQLVSASSDLATSVVLQMVPEGTQATTTPEPLPSVPTGTPTPTVSGAPSPPPSRGTAPGLVTGVPSASAPGAASASPSGSATPSGTLTPSGSASASPSGSSGSSFPLSLPAEGVTSLKVGGSQLVLTSTNRQLDPADAVTLTLRFASAGTVTLNVPFAPPASPLPRESLSATASEESE